MSNARIQFSLASEDVWNAYNPQLKEGEIVTVLKVNKKVKLVQGKVGGSTYSESTVIWDEDTAETIMSRSEAAESTATAQATAASGSASKAAASQSAAATSATNAKASENAAKTSETNAKASETAAKNSATSAASSASTASTQAGKAADSATAAAGSAAQASTFATTAINKATAADKSATAADKSATAAAASTVTASDKASEAATSARNAAVSATSAAGAAEEAQGLISKAEYGFLERNKKYAVGDIAYTTQLPAGYYLECVTAGTTGNTEPTISVESENVNDGTVKWNVKNIQDASKLGLPVGFETFTTNPNLQAGWLPLLGGEYSRTAYADLWAWVQTQQGYLLEESAWQTKATANGGNVPFYSKGDGSTTFRVPALKCWVRGAGSISEVGGYLAAGLPNITATTKAAYGENNKTTNAGALSTDIYTIGSANGRQDGGNGADGEPIQSAILTFNASKSNPIYGASATVQPPSIVGLWCVKAYGVVTNVGSTDVANIATGLAQIETRINSDIQIFNEVVLSKEVYQTEYASSDGTTTTVTPTRSTMGFALATAEGTKIALLDLDMSTIVTNCLATNNASTVFTAYIKSDSDCALGITNAGTIKYIGSASDVAITSAGLLLNIMMLKDASGNVTSIVQASSLS